METTPHVTLGAAGVRRPFIGLTAGFGAGVLGGLVARGLMRVIAISMGGVGNFSVGGTANIVMFGVMGGTVFGLLYATTIGRIRTHWLVRGLIFALVLGALIQLPIMLAVPDFAAEIMAVGPVGYGVFAGMNVAYSLILAGLAAWLDKRWPNDDSQRETEVTVLIVLGVIALIGFGVLAYEIGGRALGLVR